MKYNICISRLNIEHNLRQQKQTGQIQNLKGPIMILNENNELVEECSEIEVIGSSKIIYSPDKLLPVKGYQISLWLQVNEYKKIK